MAIRFERTQDLDLVRTILTHPAIYRCIPERISTPPEAYQPPPTNDYYLIVENHKLRGISILSEYEDYRLNVLFPR